MNAITVNWELWPKQQQAFQCKAREWLYGGSLGGGKSHLFRIALLAWCLDIPGLQAYLFRREYGDLIKNHVEGPTGFIELLGPLIQAKHADLVAREIRFANNSRIYLCHCQHEKDVTGYQGSEMHVLAVEQAEQFTEFQLRFLRTRVRAPEEFLAKLPERWHGLFPRICYSANPGGPGHGYLKRGFVDDHPPHSTWTATSSDGGMTRSYIPARLHDNPSLNAEQYREQIKGVGSEAYVRALLEGDWNATVGSFFPEFDYERHVIQDFTPPSHWFRFRTFDWGSAAPFAVYWWAVSDGMEVPSLGRPLPRGAIVAYREWYGCDTEHPAKGCGYRNEEMAEGILQRSRNETQERVITLTDSLPFQDRGGKTIALSFLEHGVALTHGDTSRIPGWSQMRGRLRGDERGPRIFFTQSCVHAIRTIPMLQHDPLDAEECIGSEDHAPDAVRLACMAFEVITDLEADEPSPERAENLQAMTFNDAIEKIQAHKRADTFGY